MKLYLLLLLCSIGINLYGQSTTDSIKHQHFSTEYIKFKSAGIILAGTIFKPRHSWAALVLVHGSGQEKRMIGMASVLAKNGITVLSYDKRGVGESGGIYAGPEVGTNNIDSTNLNLLARDANMAAEVLLAHLSKKHIPLGLMGFSQAGWIIPLAAKENPRLSFMVIFSGPVVTTLEQLRFQFYTNGNTEFWETHTEVEARKHLLNDPDRYQFIATDPQEALRKSTIPGLWLFGGKDIQAPVVLSTERLNTLKLAGKPYEYLLFPELGHNTSSTKTNEPIHAAIEWMKSISSNKKRE